MKKATPEAAAFRATLPTVRDMERARMERARDASPTDDDRTYWTRRLDSLRAES
jgi:hypothetical protein